MDELSENDFLISYHTGKANAIVDALSRKVTMCIAMIVIG